MKIIITDCDHKNIKIEEFIFQKVGIAYELRQCLTEEALIEQCQEADILLNQYAPLTKKVLEALPKLKGIVRYGVGYNNVDIDVAAQLGIQVCNVPDYGVNEVADHALALMMSLLRKTVIMNHDTKTTQWNYITAIPIRRISGLTVGIIGLGRIGKNFAHKVAALGCTVIAYDPYYKPNAQDNTDFVQSVSLHELLKRSDVISIHCPLDGAKDLINIEEFKIMKSGAYLINVARGGIVNEEALLNALKEKKIGGAAFDCMEKEPLNTDTALFTYDNFLVTPHMAWYSEEAAEELKRKAAEEAIRLIINEKIHYPVNRPLYIRS